MLKGTTLSASEMAGTAVFRIVVSSDSIKNATATSHGRSRLPEADGGDEDEAALMALLKLMITGMALAWTIRRPGPLHGGPPPPQLAPETVVLSTSTNQ
ncbi:hypothetical protein SBV1_3660002 [Verrucomicrobia bacterium]|nr:hypothetical protein SBV1_3660002 [Verrucomicrobiota bacterium]